MKLTKRSSRRHSEANVGIRDLFAEDFQAILRRFYLTKGRLIWYIIKRWNPSYRGFSEGGGFLALGICPRARRNRSIDAMGGMAWRCDLYLAWGGLPAKEGGIIRS